jgi:hypothetical protein
MENELPPHRGLTLITAGGLAIGILPFALLSWWVAVPLAIGFAVVAFLLGGWALTQAIADRNLVDAELLDPKGREGLSLAALLGSVGMMLAVVLVAGVLIQQARWEAAVDALIKGPSQPEGVRFPPRPEAVPAEPFPRLPPFPGQPPPAERMPDAEAPLAPGFPGPGPGAPRPALRERP